MRVEVVTVGNELLSGRTVDTNLADLGRALEPIGAPVVYHQTVADRVDEIGGALQKALQRSDLVIVTGGLGPTPDDLTRKAVAQALGRPLALDEQVLERIRERWRSIGGSDPMPANNELQALVPRGARVLPNPVGSAPGLQIEHQDKVVFVLPGVPSEMRAILAESILPWVQGRGREAIRYLVFRTSGMRESVLAERLQDLGQRLPGTAIAYLPHLGGVDLRIRLPEGDEARHESLRAEARRIVDERLGPYVYEEGQRSLVEVVGDLLRTRGYRIAVAESCTGGLLAARFTDMAGSSDFFERGFVSYSNLSKTELLGVPASLIEQHGAVSEPVARALARGAIEHSDAVVGVGITGIAGPSGGTPEKPVGTVHVAVASPEGERHRLYRFGGDRVGNRERSVFAALDLLRRLLVGIPEA